MSGPRRHVANHTNHGQTGPHAWRARNLWHDIRDLAVGCAWWQLSCSSRPLCAESEEEASLAQAEWDQERNAESDRAQLHWRRVCARGEGGCTWPALAALADKGPLGRWARRTARRALRAEAREHHEILYPYGVEDHTVEIRAFGKGWRDQPRIVVEVPTS